MEELAKVDEANAEKAGKGRPDVFLGDRRANGVGLGHGLFELGLGVVPLGLGNGVFDEEFLCALQVVFCERRGCFGSTELGLLQRGVLLQQEVSGSNLGARLKGDLYDLARQLRFNRNSLDRLERSHGRQKGLPGLPASHSSRHGLRGWGLQRLGAHPPYLEELDSPKASHERDDANNAENN